MLVFAECNLLHAILLSKLQGSFANLLTRHTRSFITHPTHKPHTHTRARAHTHAHTHSLTHSLIHSYTHIRTHFYKFAHENCVHFLG